MFVFSTKLRKSVNIKKHFISPSGGQGAMNDDLESNISEKLLRTNLMELLGGKGSPPAPRGGAKNLFSDFESFTEGEIKAPP